MILVAFGTIASLVLALKATLCTVTTIGDILLSNLKSRRGTLDQTSVLSLVKVKSQLTRKTVGLVGGCTGLASGVTGETLVCDLGSGADWARLFADGVRHVEEGHRRSARRAHCGEAAASGTVGGTVHALYVHSHCHKWWASRKALIHVEQSLWSHREAGVAHGCRLRAGCTGG
jgi:hypothetical protein